MSTQAVPETEPVLFALPARSTSATPSRLRPDQSVALRRGGTVAYK
jgi:hypothetical protein